LLLGREHRRLLRADVEGQPPQADKRRQASLLRVRLVELVVDEEQLRMTLQYRAFPTANRT